MKDCIEKGRASKGKEHSDACKKGQLKGDKHPRAKLKNWQIPYILFLAERGITIRAIADAYEVKHPQIVRITSRKGWIGNDD